MSMVSDIYYHGTAANAIREIIRSGLMQPNAEGKIFLARFNWQSCLMHGADRMHKGHSFVVKVDVRADANVERVFCETPGVRDTVILKTSDPVPAHVLELYVRKMNHDIDEPATLQTVKGADIIMKYLQALA